MPSSFDLYNAAVTDFRHAIDRFSRELGDLEPNACTDEITCALISNLILKIKPLTEHLPLQRQDRLEDILICMLDDDHDAQVAGLKGLPKDTLQLFLRRFQETPI